MEIGSFIELQFPNGLEYYKGNNVIRLNSCRAGIYHALRCLGCETVYLPYYQCETVRLFLKIKNIKIKYYSIDKSFTPLADLNEEGTAFVIVNYFGIMSFERMKKIASSFRNVVIDNSQAFFSEPIEDCINVYSARKFIGVPDGAYVIGKNLHHYLNEYKQDFSSDTAFFLLQRIEYGSSGKAYESRMINEKRIDNSDIMLMSKLTQTILDGTDYLKIKKKRLENFDLACKLFDEINVFNPGMHLNSTCFPMVYPLVIENDGLLNKLLHAKHFQGHWWSYLLKEVPENSFEYWLSQYMIPITIDQRYGEKEIRHIRNLIDHFLL